MEETRSYFLMLYRWRILQEYSECTSFVYQRSPTDLYAQRNARTNDMTRYGEWSVERQAAVMGLGAFSGYHRLPQLKHTY